MQLVNTIREDDEQKGPSLLNLIRSNAPLDEIRLHLAENEKLSNNNEAIAKGQKPNSSPFGSSHRYMDIKRISDIPLYRVPAQPWTSVTNDDDFVSHLISLYFTWNNCTSNWIDRDLFLRDMRSGNLESRFCSPLLVNSVLAMACLYSDYPETLAIPGDQSSRGEHFLEEAMQLLKEDEDRLSLTTFQARGSIYMCLNGMGKDRLGWLKIVEIADCARDIENNSQKMVAEAGAEAPEMTKAISTAVFGLFNACTISILGLQKPAIATRPTKLERLPRSHDPGDTWCPYPRQVEPEPAHTSCVINGVSDLMLIVWDICNYFFGDGKPATLDLENINSFYHRLQTWAETLPECIGLGCTPTPGVMDMHMRYYTVILLIFGFIEPVLEESDSATKSHIRALRFSAAHNIGAVLYQFRSQWSVDCVPGTAMQYTSVVMFTLLENLHDAQSKQAFIESFIILRSLARRWKLAKNILQLIQLTAMEMEFALPIETQIIFRDFEAELWKAEHSGGSAAFIQTLQSLLMKNEDQDGTFMTPN
ncbi:hypothetical protein N7448_007459 [Penicillium atrosanguineum]|uniref:Xylanolytic transcriptional activator regulatory domain-containing protein n=1 Tax=Penicillium atrosanguineum TaxID=1132637 RepID=A0A9W9UCR6_9EURO|nr:GTPase Obg [Penicillium atrosanguineum]KAJ5126680.1 hypothetical protein N7448_007459 [Penicillium atrosanguineum]KAJ5146885.1 hypothetical protein N7526_000237 [Penicillium atrosanguineum]KAJ5314631.1 GTPase Obg [Penicillium atrosanguineum]KAJ5331802.1 hypothetical protein N7476_001585 [Penicillium atrosanguineum]